MDVQVVEKEKMQVAGLSHRGAYNGIGEKFAQLQDLAPAPEKRMGTVALYYDDPHSTPEEDLRSLAGIIVSDGEKIAGLENAEIPAGKYAMATFIGDYIELPKAWEEFYGAIFAQGLKTKADLCFEQYRNMPGEVPDDQLKTELYAPLA